MPIVTTAAILDRFATTPVSGRRHPLDGPPADAVLFVLVDALRHDYVGRTRFLRRIAAESVTGQIEEPFGFCPRGAWFGGLTMAAQGYTNLFRHDPVSSPFAFVRELAAGDADDAALGPALRAEIVQRARGRVPAFAAAYLDPLEIPLPWLASFDVSERESPASPRAGYRSLFHHLDETRQPWLDVSWPYPGWVGGLSSGRVAGQALDRLESRHRFAFVHLPDLDMVGHAGGPGSVALQAALDDADRLCEILAARVCALHRDPVVLFAGDHGMLPVVRHVDVATALASTGLRFGDDVTYFIDSTMVRVWTRAHGALARVHAALETCGGGRWLTEADLARYELTGIDPRATGAIFLADAGVLFTPNFFDWRGVRPAKGMHGYAPDVPDNRAALIAWRPRRPEAGAAGVVPARTLHPALQSWLGLPVAPEAWPAPTEPAATRGRWSVGGTAAADAVVDAHLAHVVARVHARTPDAVAVVLAGGFGRGEGTVCDAGDGRPRPVNDYDVVVVGGDGAALRGLDGELSAELGIDFVDLWPRSDLTPSTPVSQFDFDLGEGATRLAGDPLVLERLPRRAPAELDLDEGLFQLGNRAGGVLLGVCGRTEGAAAPADDAFRERQRVKFLIAIADAWLMAHADYHPSYVIRRARFASLGGGVFGPTVRDLVDGAFAAKLHGSATSAASADLAARHCAAALDELWTTLGLHREPARLTDALSRTVRRRVRASSDWIAGAQARGLTISAAGAADPLAAATAIYRAALEGVRAWPLTVAARRERLAAAVAPEFAISAAAEPWAGVARTWITFFHP